MKSRSGTAAGNNKLFSVLIWGTVIFFSILYISLIFNDNLWTDEVFTMTALNKKSVGEMVAYLITDVHPPLYYFYTRVFHFFFGNSVQAQKIASIIPMTALLIYSASVIRKIFGDKASFLFNLFICCIPCSMEFAVQVRMYSLALFFVTICGVSAYTAFSSGEKKYFLYYSAALLGAAYTHYFSFVSVIWIGVILFFFIVVRKRKLFKAFAVSTITQIILYIPWMSPMFSQIKRVRADYWIQPITPETVWGYFKWTFGLQLVPYVEYIFTAGLVVIGLRLIYLLLKKKYSYMPALAAMLIPALTCLLGILLSVMPGKSPIYRDQYIFPALGLLALFFAITVKDLNRIVLTIICAFLLFVGAVQYKEVYRQEYKSTYLVQTRKFFNENIKDDDILMYTWDIYGFIYRYYFPDNNVVFMDDFDWESNTKTVWLMYSTFNSLPGGDYFNSHYTMEHMGHFGIEHSEFELYKIGRTQP